MVKLSTELERNEEMRKRIDFLSSKGFWIKSLDGDSVTIVDLKTDKRFNFLTLEDAYHSIKKFYEDKE